MPDRDNAIDSAAMNVAEALILLLIEKGLVSADHMVEALDDVVDHHRNLAGTIGMAAAQARRHSEVARAISNRFCSGNLHAVATESGRGKRHQR
jgi:hypothetical protein